MPVGMAVFVSLNMSLYLQRLQSLQHLLPTIRRYQRKGGHLEISLGKPEQRGAIHLTESIYVLRHPLFAKPIRDVLCWPSCHLLHLGCGYVEDKKGPQTRREGLQEAQLSMGQCYVLSTFGTWCFFAPRGSPASSWMDREQEVSSKVSQGSG